MGTRGCGATQVVTVSLACKTLTSWPVLAFQMNMAPPSEPEHTNSLWLPIRDTCTVHGQQSEQWDNGFPSFYCPSCCHHPGLTGHTFAPGEVKPCTSNAPSQHVSTAGE